MVRKKQPHALAQRLGAFFAAPTVADVVAPVAPRPRLPQFEKRRLARQLLATLSQAVLAETGHSEGRGHDRAGPRTRRPPRRD
jgi:hypothetical protein